METLTFKIEASFTQAYKVQAKSIELGDRQQCISVAVGKLIEESWQVSTPPITEAQWEDLDTLLKSIAGRDFNWRPDPSYSLAIWRCNQWSHTKTSQDYYTVSLSMTRAQTQQIDECINAAESTGIPMFPFNAFSWGFSQSTSHKNYEKQLDSGITQIEAYSYNATINTWAVERVLTNTDRDLIHAFLKAQCGRPFNFKATPDATPRLHTCLDWQFSHLDTGLNYWQFKASFTENLSPYKESPVEALLGQFDFYNDRASIIAAVSSDFSNIRQWIDDAKAFISTYTRNTLPLLLNSNYLMVNSFHTVLGRGGYFPGSAGPTEAQAVLARAAMVAYYATNDTYWRTLAINAGNALLNYFYSLPIPNNWTPANGIRVPHWLINIKSSFVSKGATAPDPLNYGFFDLTLTFFDGTAQIPTGAPHYGELLANVYRVYPTGDRLLWQNVYAYPLGGYSYPIDYWVTNVMLEGIVSRQYADSESPGGRAPTPTGESAGTIKLAIPYTGTAKIVYSAYVGPTIGVNELFEPYPMWRKLRTGEALAAFDVFPWSEDAFDLLHQATGDSKWSNAQACTIYSEEQVATVTNPSRWFAKDDSANPFVFPGSQVVLANHNPGNVATASRVYGGDKDQWIDINIPASTLPYPSAEYQNFAVQIEAVEGMLVNVGVACSQATELEIVLSLSRNPFDFSRYYIARVGVPANQATYRTYQVDDFLFWETQRTAWHPHIADNPIYTYSGGGGTVTVTRLENPIGLFNRWVWRAQMTKGDGFAGAGLVMLGKLPSFPLKMLYRNLGGRCGLKLIADNTEFYYELPSTNWTEASFGNASFTAVNGAKPRSAAIIQKIEVYPLTNTQTDFAIWWVGFRPLTMQLPTQTYKAAIVSRISTAHTLSIGQFEAIGSPSSQLTYNPGAVPFTCNVVGDGSGGQSIDSWRGAPYSGYQYPAWYVKQGYWLRLDLVLDFLLEAQEQYAAQNTNKTKGPYMPVFYWGYWDAGELSPNGTDIWSYLGSDPNTEWCGYYSRPVESVAHAWYRLATGDYPGSPPANIAALISKAQKCTMQYLWWLSSFYTRRNSIQPPTNFPPSVDPEVRYHEPHQAAFYLRTAIYANLAGGDPATTIRLIKASLDYLKSQRVATGSMLGSFSAGQPVFPSDPIYREYFGFWHLEIVEALALLEQKKMLLNYPDCLYLLR